MSLRRTLILGGGRLIGEGVQLRGAGGRPRVWRSGVCTPDDREGDEPSDANEGEVSSEPAALSVSEDTWLAAALADAIALEEGGGMAAAAEAGSLLLPGVAFCRRISFCARRGDERGACDKRGAGAVARRLDDDKEEAETTDPDEEAAAEETAAGAAEADEESAPDAVLVPAPLEFAPFT